MMAWAKVFRGHLSNREPPGASRPDPLAVAIRKALLFDEPVPQMICLKKLRPTDFVSAHPTREVHLSAPRSMLTAFGSVVAPSV
jgi:hypothetical protein